ncbi:hypothetical protein F66182_4859 [Fusarium sp. NRRL 66182]|nr:hypothetical protein F66182_4859 [Fusarium sp. NRRL 66182]
MPFYQVYHSCVLNQDERQAFATAITELHCEAFKTPSFFVHVQFLAEGSSDETYFLAGKPHTSTSNRVIGLVRTSAARTRADFDDPAVKIEAAWYDTLQISSPAEKEKWDSEGEARRLIMVTFLPMLALREGGMSIPEAGQEESWLREQTPFIESMANRGIEDFSDLLSELRGDVSQR